MKFEVNFSINLEGSKKKSVESDLINLDEIIEQSERDLKWINDRLETTGSSSNLIELESKKKQRGSITVDYTVVLPIVKKGFSSYEIDLSSASDHMFGNGNYRRYLGGKFRSVEDIKSAIERYNMNHMSEKMPKITSYNMPA
jgi:hypothetical protein